MDEKYVRGFIKWDEFEQLAPPMLEHVKGPCEKVLIEEGVIVNKIHAVEVVGLGYRIPTISKYWLRLLERNRGRLWIQVSGWLENVLSSVLFLVWHSKCVNSRFKRVFHFLLFWSRRDLLRRLKMEVQSNNKWQIVFLKGNTLPITNVLTFFRPGAFTIDILYAEVNQFGCL